MSEQVEVKKLELKIEQHWVEGGELFFRVSCSDRPKLVADIRSFVVAEIAAGNVKREDGTIDDLRSWSNAGVEKIESPLAYDTDYPGEDAHALATKFPGKKFNWQYSQVVRLITPI